MDFIQKECENLMELNDDCLLHILSFFKLVELMELRGICRRLDTMILQSRTRFTELDYISRHLRRNASNSDAEFFEKLQFLGPALKSLKFGYIEDKIPIENFKNVSNLKSLTIKNCQKLTIAGCTQFLKKNLKLENLEIEFSGYAYTKPGKSAELLLNFITTRLKEIESLSINAFSYNIHLLADLPKLKKLRIVKEVNPEKEATEAINQLLEKLSEKNQIEEFETKYIEHRLNMDLISKLTNLKKLSLCVFYEGIYYEITKLQSLQNLESLEIFRLKSDSVTLDLIKSLPKLLCIYLKDVNLEFTKQLIQILKHSQNRPILTIRVENYSSRNEIDDIKEWLDANKSIIDYESAY